MKHLTLEERETIKSLLKANNTFTYIGNQIGKENIKKLGFYFISPKDIILKPSLFNSK